MMVLVFYIIPDIEPVEVVHLNNISKRNTVNIQNKYGGMVGADICMITGRHQETVVLHGITQIHQTYMTLFTTNG